MTDATTTTTIYRCDVANCGAAFDTFDTLVYHTVGEHYDLAKTLSWQAAKCPLCPDTFLLIRGAFCEDHYVLVHQTPTSIKYSSWLKNASKLAAENVEALLQLPTTVVYGQEKRVPPTPVDEYEEEREGAPSMPAGERTAREKRTAAPAPVATLSDAQPKQPAMERKPSAAKKPIRQRARDSKEDVGKSGQRQIPKEEQNELFVNENDDEEEEAESSSFEARVQTAVSMIQGHMNKDLDGASLFLNLPYENAEEYLRMGFSYEVVDAAMTSLARVAEADMDM